MDRARKPVSGYVETVALAYLAAPAESEEESLLRAALDLACTRHGIGAELDVIEPLLDTHRARIDRIDEQDVETGDARRVIDRNGACLACGRHAARHVHGSCAEAQVEAARAVAKEEKERREMLAAELERRCATGARERAALIESAALAALPGCIGRLSGRFEDREAMSRACVLARDAGRFFATTMLGPEAEPSR